MSHSHGQRGNQLGGQRGNQLGGQRGNQLGGQRGNQLGGQRGNQLGGQRGDRQPFNRRNNKSCPIPTIFYRNILGDGGANKREIEVETRTRIIIPGKQNPGDIIVYGSTEVDVASAIEKLYAIVDEARLKLRPSHFVSIPMNFRYLKTRFNEFKQRILSDSECSQSRGVCEELFQNENKLHLSIVMLLLGHKQEIDKAKAMKILQECKKFIDKQLKGKKLVIRIKGLGIDPWIDNPSNCKKTNIVYGKVEKNDDLGIISDEILTRFVNCRLSKYDEVRWHLTLMNTAFKQYKDEENETFDASAILKNFGSNYFGQFKINQIHLSIVRRWGVPDDPNAYFQRIFKIDF